MNISRNEGFTLIEVLIASLIMFISIAAFSMVFRSALISSSSAENHVATSSIIPLIQNEISHHLQMKTDNGQGRLLGRNYRWTAKKLKETKPPPRYLAEKIVQQNHTATLWQVTLIVSYKGRETEYELGEISW